MTASARVIGFGRSMFEGMRPRGFLRRSIGTALAAMALVVAACSQPSDPATEPEEAAPPTPTFDGGVRRIDAGTTNGVSSEIGARTRCSIGRPTFTEAAGVGTITTLFQCGSSGDPYRVGDQILVGLTAYSAEDHYVRPAPSQGGRERLLLVDGGSGYDFDAKSLTIDAASAAFEIRYQAPMASIYEMEYLLIAAWPASARRSCDAEDGERFSRSGRSGCQQFGYIIDTSRDEFAVSPLSVYPGLRTAESVGYQDSDAWIVEKFR